MTEQQKKQYKKEWYQKNRERILRNAKLRYQEKKQQQNEKE